MSVNRLAGMSDVGAMDRTHGHGEAGIASPHESAPIMGAHGSAGGVSAHPPEIVRLLRRAHMLMAYLEGDTGHGAFVEATKDCAIPGAVALDRFRKALDAVHPPPAPWSLFGEAEA